MGQLLWGTLYGGWNEAKWLRSGLPNAGGNRLQVARPYAARHCFDRITASASVGARPRRVRRRHKP